MSIVPMRWGVTYFPGLRFTAYVAIFRKDGTMAISHGGVEIGQGIDTKVLLVFCWGEIMLESAYISMEHCNVTLYTWKRCNLRFMYRQH